MHPLEDNIRNGINDFILSYNTTHRHAIVFPVTCRTNIQEALERVNFRFHRVCSFSNLLQEYNAQGKQTLLIFCGSQESESISISPSSCSSFLMATNTPNLSTQHEKEVRSCGQQTDISCRYLPGICPPGTEDPRLFRAQIADSLMFSSPPSSVLQNTGRSLSILGSVCALLLAKQVSTTKEVSNISVSRHSNNICRICFGGESTERLIQPCSCRGTIAAVHRACLERWLLQASTSYCELCRHHYIVTRSHKWSLIRSMWEWARSGRGMALAADVGRGAALGAASALGTARALLAADALLQAGARRGGSAALAANLVSSVVIGIIGALNGLLTTWMLLKIQEHQASWRAWRDSTVHVRVALDEPTPTPTLTPSPTPSDVSFATVICDPPDATVERSTNIADPFMVSLPYFQPDP